MNTKKTIAPTVLRDYLVKALGWEVLDAALQDRLFVLSHPSHPRRQLIYPMDSTAIDYTEAVGRVFEKLSESTQKTPENLLIAAQNLHDDIISFRIHAENQGYTLPLNFAVSLIQSTEKLIKSAACTVLQPMRHHRKLYRSEASALIKKSRFQQTEQGSFVLKIACPIDAIQTQINLSFEDNQIPFGRQVTKNLQKSIATLVTAIETNKLTQLVDKLTTEEAPLISSNLCDALAEMQDQEIENSLDFGVAWSALYAFPHNFGHAKIIRLQRDYFRPIEEVGRSLRSTEPHREDIYIGTVERLDGVMDAAGQRAGDVWLSLMLPDEDGLIKAKVCLSAKDYAKALRAHETNRTYVQLKGRLHAGQRVCQITHLTSFELIANPAQEV